MPDKAEGIGDRKHCPQRGQSRDQPGIAQPGGLRRLIQHHFLGQKAVQRRDARHRQGGHGGNGKGHRHQVAQPAQTADVARMRLVVHDARRHEEGSLETGVVQDVEHGHHGGLGRAKAQQHGDQAQVADRGIGEQRLQIILEQGHNRAQQHRDQPGRGDDVKPFGRARQHRPHPRHQEQARLHHGGGMQIGRHRRGRGHRLRQPEVEGELRRFGETAQQDQDQRRQIPVRRLDRLFLRQDHRQIEAARESAQNEHARDHRQPAGTGDGQRHPRALPPFGQVFPIADQQKGRERGQLPEHQQQQDVVRQHDAQHRPLEQQQIGVELPHRVRRGQVEPGIEDDQQADPQDQQGKQQTQPVQHEIGVQPQLRQPVDAGLNHLAAQHGGNVQTDHQQRQRGNGACGQRAGGSSGADQQAGKERTKEGQRCDQGKGHVRGRSVLLEYAGRRRMGLPPFVRHVGRPRQWLRCAEGREDAALISPAASSPCAGARVPAPAGVPAR